jgi:peptidase C25-like protein
MLTNFLNDKSIKLSVTVKSRLEDKYAPADLQQINNKVKGWIEADDKRGIQTVHVHVDDTKEMDEFGVTPVSAKPTPEEIKEAIEKLWVSDKFPSPPHYLVLFGAEDIVPMFPVPNPSYDPNGIDKDPTVPSDNPYATPLDFNPLDPTNSYLIPQRAIGRIPDMVSDPEGPKHKGDPAWFVRYLDTATKWESRNKSDYKDPYAICTAEARFAGNDFMQKTFDDPGLRPFICPTDSDAVDSPTSRDHLSPGLHIIKCHGNKGDPTFWGFSVLDQRKKEHPCAAITSASLTALLKSSAVVASMCCYGAQIFLPPDPNARSRGEWPVASTYLRNGALGFVGSTMMAWVGLSKMGAADWLVQGYLKNVLGGDSIGNAFLASKQDYRGHYSMNDDILAEEEEKTLIEYILLGDPSIHPVISSQSSPDRRTVQSRWRRRDARARLAAGIRDCLPTRSDATKDEKDRAKAVFKSAKEEIRKAKQGVTKLRKFGIKATAVQVKRVDAPLPKSKETRQSLEYYWRGKRDRGGQTQFCVLKTETDRDGNLVPGRTTLTYTS